MYEYRVIIDRWVDGDTVDVDIDLGFGVWLKDQRVRLYGINAPESRTRDLEEKKLGLAAKDFCKNFAKEGNPPFSRQRNMMPRVSSVGYWGRYGARVSSLINL